MFKLDLVWGYAYDQILAICMRREEEEVICLLETSRFLRGVGWAWRGRGRYRRRLK